MPHQEQAAPSSADMGLFERYLSLWVAAAIVAGIALGQWAPAIPEALSRFEYAQVSIPIAVLIWAMIFPMMAQIDFSAIAGVRRQPKGLAITTTVNWLIKPFTMFALAWLFFMVIFKPWIPDALASQYLAGAILLSAAPCTAMVFVWSQLTKGDPAYTLVQVAANDLIMIVAFAPIVALLLGVTDIAVPWETLLLSVALYVVVPLGGGAFVRHRLLAAHGGDEAAVTEFTGRMKPLSIIGLLLTVLLLFGFQAETIVARPLLIALIAAPIIVQSYGIFLIAYGWAKAWKVPHAVAAPCALIGTSNFFELAVAVAIGLFGLGSGAALATVVGVLVEVPVMLSLVAFANRSRRSFAPG